jgi:HK97 family phage prohead protease
MTSVERGWAQPITEVKAAGDGTWEVAGYASVFDVVDLGNDVVERGAFRESLGKGGKVRFLYGHDHQAVLGVPIELKEDTHGLYGRFKISRTRLGEEVRTLLRDGALDSFSIGYLTRDFYFDERKDVRHLTGVDLLEISVVAVPMAPEARVSSVKRAAAGRGRSLEGLGLHLELTRRRLQRLGVLDHDPRLVATPSAGASPPSAPSAQAVVLRQRLALAKRRLERLSIHA